MRLYHGTDTLIDEPRILVPNRTLDFGQGFYLTTDEAQARTWSRTVARRHGSPSTYVHMYDLADEDLAHLDVTRFDRPSKEWLEYVTAHRFDRFDGPAVDVVIGPVANDRTIPVLQQYMQAEDKEAFAPVALTLIKAENLVDQVTIKTARALSYLTLVEVVTDERP